MKRSRCSAQSLRLTATSLGILFFVILIPAASAHAVFASSDPAPDSQSPVGIGRVTVTLSEDVILDFSGLEVADLQGADWTNGAVAHAGSRNTLTVETRPLVDGLYIVNWKALSSDTHTTRGSFLIAVGNATLSESSGAIDETPDNSAGSRVDALARTAQYAGIVLAIGIPFFFLAVDRDRGAPRSALVVASGFAALGSLGGFVNLAGLSRRAEVAVQDIAFTEGGIFVTLRALFILVAAALLVAASLTRQGTRRVFMVLGVIAGLAALVSTSLSSHSGSVTEDASLALASDMTHMLVASIWLGGVAAFLFAIRGRSSKELGKLVARFSPIAMASVALILATGVYASVRFVRHWSALFTEPYGRFVFAKIVLVVVLIGFGAFQQRFVHPRLNDESTSPRTFRRVIQVEAVVMALVVLVAGALATTSPPREEVVTTRIPLILEFTANSTLTHLVVQVTPNPVTIGVQTIRVYLHEQTAARVPNSTIVQLKIWHETEPEPDVSVTPEKSNGTAEWTLKGGHFTSVGKWNLKVLYQRPDEGFERFTFEVPVVATTGK